MDLNNRPIGFFDSGVGGISVLKEAIKLMPEENYIYFGDSINAPYGEKSTEEVRELSIKATEKLMDLQCKAIVIACNTATSAAIKKIRAKYKNVPIIGIEPALKPAIEKNTGGKIIIMATPITLREKKFKRLLERYDEDKDIELVPCPGLAELIESGNIEGKRIEEYLKDRIGKYREEEVEQIVLGCTHYPFIQRSIKDIIGSNVEIIHGGEGTARQLKRKLKHNNIKLHNNESGYIEIINSKSEELVEFCQELL